MLAEAKTCAGAPPTISSLSVPEAPNFACTLTPVAASNAAPASVTAERKRPAAKRCTGPAASAGPVIAMIAIAVARAWDSSCPRRVGVGEEQLLAVDLVGGNRFLAFVGNEPVDEGLAQILLDVRMLRRVYQ